MKHLSKALYVIGTIGFLLRPLIITKYGSIILLGYYALIMSIIVPISFLIGSSREIKLLSEYINNKNISLSINNMFEFIKLNFLIFILTTFIYFLLDFKWTIYVLFFSSNISQIYLGSILRCKSETKYSYFIFLRMILIVAFSYLSAKFNNLYFLALSDVILVFIFSIKHVNLISYYKYNLLIPK